MADDIYFVCIGFNLESNASCYLVLATVKHPLFIFCCADKILKDDWDVIAYRILAYLLLGVVRIYSKKVEYLFDDCHDVLTEINKFVVSTKEKEDTDTLRAPYDSVTLPERFELDAFDFGILEDVSG